MNEKKINEFAFNLGVLTAQLTREEIQAYLISKGVKNTDIQIAITYLKCIAEMAFYEPRRN